MVKVVAVFTMTLCFLCGISSEVFCAEENGNVKKMIFEERRIEGKIRRPQLVLIKAEQRPEFAPMVIQSLGKTGSIAGSVDKDILDWSPYDDAFRIKKGRIENYVP